MKSISLEQKLINRLVQSFIESHKYPGTEFFQARTTHEILLVKDLLGEEAVEQAAQLAKEQLQMA